MILSVVPFLALSTSLSAMESAHSSHWIISLCKTPIVRCMNDPFAHYFLFFLYSRCYGKNWKRPTFALIWYPLCCDDLCCFMHSFFKWISLSHAIRTLFYCNFISQSLMQFNFEHSDTHNHFPASEYEIRSTILFHTIPQNRNTGKFQADFFSGSTIFNSNLSDHHRLKLHH